MIKISVIKRDSGVKLSKKEGLPRSNCNNCFEQ